MRRIQLLLALTATVAVVATCSHDESSPTGPLSVDPNLIASACRPIPDDFLDDDWPAPAHLGLEHRIAHIRYLLKIKQQAQAQTEMFQLWDLVLKAYYAGKLPGGTSVRTQKLVLFVGQALYCWVGLDATGLTLNDPSSGDMTQVVFPSATDQDLVHGTGNAGVRIYGNTLTAPVTITITAITTAFNPFFGPLNTPLDQYGPYFHFGAVPDLTFPNAVLVEECLVAPVGDLPASVDLAHNVGTGVEILPKASDHLLSCTTIGQGGPGARELWNQGKYGSAIGRLGSEALALFQPALAWAGGTGVSGKPKNFSPFGGVDTLVTMDAVSPTTQSAAAGTAVASPPKVRVHTNGTRHASVPGVSVTFAVTAGGGSLVAVGGAAGATTVVATTDTSGTAAVGSWTVGAGANTVSTTGTFPAPPKGASAALGPPVIFSATGQTAGSSSFGGNWVSPPNSYVSQFALMQAPNGTVTGEFVDEAFCIYLVSGSVVNGVLSLPAWTYVAGTGNQQGACAALAPTLTFSATLSADGTTFSGTLLSSGAPRLSLVEARQVASAATIAINAGDGQSAAAGSAVPIAPSVKVTDANNQAVFGFPVTFAVTGGGGTIVTANAFTDYQGIASAGSWTLGTSPGANALSATATGLSGSPVTITATGLGGFAAASLTTGSYHVCALTGAGAAYCWGNNSNGQLGDGTTTTHNSPVAVQGGLQFAAITAGAYSTCGVTTAGVAYCWGGNSYGQLGDGTNSDRSSPTLVQGGQTFVAISGRYYHTCGIVQGGPVYCWGWNNNGQLGDGTATNSATPVPVQGGISFTSVTTAAAHSCGIVSVTSNAYCWGDNSDGELGNSTGGIPGGAVTVLGGPYTAITSGPGGLHTCALTGSGAAYCWGDNEYSQFGNGSNAGGFTPMPVSGGITFASLSAGWTGTCGVSTTGNAYCWGRNLVGGIGNGSTTPGYFTTPAAVSGGLAFSSVINGAEFACGITTAGAVYCWGDNTYGQLGNGGNANSAVPVPIP